MSNNILDRIKRGSADLPPRVVVAGPEGIGKSTFASKAPNPLFIAAEDGLTGLDHVQRITPTDLTELNALLDSLSADPNGFKSLVVDTTDWLERLIAQSICKRDGKSDIEDYGYGKGYVVLEGETVKLMQKLDMIRAKHKLWIILLSHVQIRTFNSPEGDTYDRYEAKGHKRFTGLLREWSDCNLFAVNQVFKTKGKGEKKEKTIGGERVMHTQWSPAWDAKNRLNLPDTIPLEWDEFEMAVAENSNASLCSKVRALYATAKLSEADKARWDKFLPRLESLTADKIKSAIEALNKLQ